MGGNASEGVFEVPFLRPLFLATPLFAGEIGVEPSAVVGSLSNASAKAFIDAVFPEWTTNLDSLRESKNCKNVLSP